MSFEAPEEVRWFSESQLNEEEAKLNVLNGKPPPGLGLL
jgi:hypothetical protein